MRQGTWCIILAIVALAASSLACGLGSPQPEAADTPTPSTDTAVPTDTLTARPTETPFPTHNPTPLRTDTPEPSHTSDPTEGSLGDTWTRPADGMVMVYVPAGEFQMGSTDAEVDAALDLCNQYRDDCPREWFEREQPMHTVALDGFWIDRTEVTNRQYAWCVAQGACDEPPRPWHCWRRQDSYYGNWAYSDYPVNMVTWHDATAYCTWAGARLPTEAEWEKAARGPTGRAYPWGDESPDCTLANLHPGCVGDTSEVGSYPAGASPYGVLDMAGNVDEWVNDWFETDYYGSSPYRNPQGPENGTHKVIRGGSFASTVADRSARRLGQEPHLISDRTGFRCARSSE